MRQKKGAHRAPDVPGAGDCDSIRGRSHRRELVPAIDMAALLTDAASDSMPASLLGVLSAGLLMTCRIDADRCDLLSSSLFWKLWQSEQFSLKGSCLHRGRFNATLYPCDQRQFRVRYVEG